MCVENASGRNRGIAPFKERRVGLQLQAFPTPTTPSAGSGQVFAKCAKDGAPHFGCHFGKIKGLGYPPGVKYAVGVVPSVFLNIEMNALGVL